MVLSCNFFVPYTALQAGFHPRERRTNCATGNNNKQNYKIMKKKLYEIPESELLVVTFDQVIMGPSDPTPTTTTFTEEDDDIFGQ